MLDKRAKCEVTKQELAQILQHEIRIDPHIRIQALDLVISESLRYQTFMNIFVPKSQKVQAELQKKPYKNLNGTLEYSECFDGLT